MKTAGEKCHIVREVKDIDDDVFIYRLVSQSKGNCLPATGIIKNKRNNSVYRTLYRLCGWKNEDGIPGIRLFCFDDLTKEIASSDYQVDWRSFCARKPLTVQFEILKEKLKESYGYLFPQWEWGKVKVRSIDTYTLVVNECNRASRNSHHYHHGGQQQEDENIIIKFYPDEEDYERKVQLTLRFKLTGNIKDYPPEMASFISTVELPKSCFPKGSPIRKLRKGSRISLDDVPLMAEKKDGKLYFRTLSMESYHSSKYRRACLDTTMNQKGKKLIESYEKKIADLTSSYDSSHDNTKPPYQNDRKRRTINKLRNKISKIKKDMRYYDSSMNVKGLLDYKSKEQDDEEFKKSIRCLAESDQYQQRVREMYYPDDTFSYPEDLQPLLPTSSHVYKIKTKFPFLSHYDSLERSLPEGFILNLLSELADRIERLPTPVRHVGMRTTSPHDLNYYISKFFYDRIKSYVNESKSSSGSKKLSYYLSEVGEYLRDRKTKMWVHREKDRRLFMLEKRYADLHEEIRTVVEDNKEKEIIPIYRNIRKVGPRLPVHDISDVLKSIEARYADRFILSNTCLIEKSKAKRLKLLLKGEPMHKQACILLIKNGVPKPCLTDCSDLLPNDLLPKLGFGFRFEKDLNSNRVVKLNTNGASSSAISAPLASIFRRRS